MVGLAKMVNQRQCGMVATMKSDIHDQNSMVDHVSKVMVAKSGRAITGL